MARGRLLKLAPLGCLPADLSVRTTQVVLACAHLDHDPGNNVLANLRAFYQHCHILHDRPKHLRQRWLTYRLRRLTVICSWGHIDLDAPACSRSTGKALSAC